jgi:hypothetical protein
VLVLTKLGRIALALAAVAGAALPAAPVAAAKTICVGLVVDARSLGGELSTDCTTVPDGSTGYDVLKAAGHTVGFRQDGLICTIDNRPADGCEATDAIHYWAYFHREAHASSWSYSSEGATTYQPDNGESEGWVWRNGDMAKPANVPYSTICPQAASPHPSAARSTQSARPRATPSASQSPANTAPTTVSRSSAPTPSRPSRPARQHSPSATTQPAHEVPATTSPTAVAAITSPNSDGSSGPPWGLLLGLVVIAGLGGAAAFVWRRRSAE